MWHGWTGAELEVNLSTGNIEKREGDREVNAKYLGGRGLASKIFWDRVRPEVEPFSEENLLVFAPGVLNGTIAPAANRTSLVTRSPLNGYFTYNSAGGFFGPELKFAGYDALVIGGKASTPVYLFINDDKVEIRDARHLWGKDTIQTQALIRQELKNDKVHIMCIGPAGENKVLYASIEHLPAASMSRTGPGAIMGDKNLKAIAVYGTKDVNLARPLEMLQLCEVVHARDKDLSEKYIEQYSVELTQMVYAKSYHGYMRELMPKDAIGIAEMNDEFLKKHDSVRVGCYNCKQACIRSPRGEGGQAYPQKCSSTSLFMPLLDIRDFEFNLKAYALTQRYGFDTCSLALCAAFGIDLYQKGILTKEDTDGMHLEFGNPEVALALFEKIARREGIGDILANGTVEAARQIGRGAEAMPYHNAKLELFPYNRQRLYTGMIAALSDRQDAIRLVGGVPFWVLTFPEEARKAYAQSVYWPYPEEWKQYMDAPLDTTSSDWERLSKMVAFDANALPLDDCTGICHFQTGFFPYGPIRPEDEARFITYATGVEMDVETAMDASRRAAGLVRAYNAIMGHRTTSQILHQRFYEDPAPPYPPLKREMIDKAIEETNRLRGCDPGGIPTKEFLDGVGLSFVADELEARGILPRAVAEVAPVTI